MTQIEKYFPTPLQQFQYYDKYSRWIPDLGRRENWPETVNRSLSFLRKNTPGSVLDASVWLQLERAMLNLDALPSMRLVQMSGPALERDNVGAFNCAYCAIDSLGSFTEILYILMQGTGIGYSVEDQYVSRLPRIKRQRNSPKLRYTIPDTTEGWCDALKTGIHAWFDGHDVDFDYKEIRPAGASLRTKGGKASGPQPLKELLDFTRERILANQKGKLSSLDCHDIACYCGWIVQVGGVRRAALICLSDLYDRDIAECKNGEFWKRFPYRSMSNNSAVYDEKPSAVDFMEEWLNLAKSGTGERGIFNRNCSIPKRRKHDTFGGNPCLEIVLRNRQFCNLSQAVARDSDDIESLKQKVRIASIFGTLQSTLTYFPYLDPRWAENCIEERLLGADITGQRDCYLFNGAGKDHVFSALRKVAIDTNIEFAGLLGINRSVAVTAGKPSGNSSQLLNCSSGCHVRKSPYYIRRVRAGAYTSVTKLLKDAGVPWFPETGHDSANPTVVVFEFPVKSPDGAIVQADVTAKDQFEFWLASKMNYTEHTQSCSVYVEDHEWLSIGGLVYDNWDKISGLSFYPKDTAIYPLQPYESISKEEYETRLANFPILDWSKLVDYEKSDETTLALEYGCTSGQCEL